MHRRFWILPLLAVAGLVLLAPAASAAPETDACTITGYTTPDDGAALGSSVAGQRPEVAPAGVPLHDGATWLVPDGQQPVVAVRGGAGSSDASLVIAGVGRPMRTADAYATTGGLGSTTRVAGIDLRFGACAARFTIVADRPMYATLVGAVGAAAVLVGVAGSVLLVRRRRPGLVGRVLLAAPFAAVAGAGQAALLHESGAVSPFSRVIWWLPVVGIALLVVVSLAVATIHRGRRGVPSPYEPAAEAPAPEPAVEPAAVGAAARPVGGQSKRAGRLAIPAVTIAVVLAVAFAAAWPREVAASRAETVDPAAARVVFGSVWDEARAGRFDRMEEPAKIFASGLMESYRGMRTSEVTDLAVGVPPGQTGYPAYFVATARTALGDGRTGFFYSLMTRDRADAPWTMREFRMSTSESASVRPKMSGGYLAPLPPVADLAFDPATTAQRFADWVDRSAKAQKVVPDEVMALDGVGDDGITSIATKFAGARGSGVYRDYTVTPAETRPELVPLLDGTVLVSFAVDVHIEVYNNSRPSTRPCTVSWLFLDDTDSSHYQTLSLDRRRHPIAEVPAKGAKAIVHDNVEREISATGKRC